MIAAPIARGPGRRNELGGTPGTVEAGDRWPQCRLGGLHAEILDAPLPPGLAGLARRIEALLGPGRNHDRRARAAYRSL